MKTIITSCLAVLCSTAQAQSLNLTDIYLDTVTTIQFVGNGNIQKAISGSNEGIPANTGIGVIYREFMPLNKRLLGLHNFELSLNINIASTVDTIKSTFDAATGKMNNQVDFGNSILLPSNSGQSFNVSFKGYFGRKDSNGIYKPDAFCKLLSGFYMNLTGSNRNWANDERYVKSSVLSLQAGIFHDFIGREHRNLGYSICIGLGYTSRFVLGDIAHEDNDAIRESLLGTRALSFHGAEFMLAIQLKNIKASIRIPYLYSSREVPGLSGVQPNTMIGFVGGFTLALKQ